MKRYLLFFFRQCYPSGGMDDLQGGYDTLQDAVDAIETVYMNTEGPGADCTEIWVWYEAHVYDTQEQRVVWRDPNSAEP